MRLTKEGCARGKAIGREAQYGHRTLRRAKDICWDVCSAKSRIPWRKSMGLKIAKDACGGFMGNVGGKVE